MSSDPKKPSPSGRIPTGKRRAMLERLRSLSENRGAPPTPNDGDRPVDGGSGFRPAPTAIEPLPPATDLLPEDARPTIQDMRKLPKRQPVRAPTTDAATSKLERVREPTPAPLPPSPLAEEAASAWFEQVPTSPAGADFPPLTSGVGQSSITPVEARTGAQVAVPARKQRIGPQPSATPAASPAWMLMALLSVTSLAVGMVLGALLFGGSTDEPIVAPDDAGVCAPRDDARTPRTHRSKRAPESPGPRN